MTQFYLQFAHYITACGHRIAHRKWKETKLQRHSWARQQAWLLFSFFPFPVGHPTYVRRLYKFGSLKAVPRSFVLVSEIYRVVLRYIALLASANISNVARLSLNMMSCGSRRNETKMRATDCGSSRATVYYNAAGGVLVNI